jgi:DNA polymerase III subunit delta
MIIFLYGEDSFRSNQKILELKEKFLESSPAGAGLSIFDYSDKNFRDKLLDILDIPNLLSPKRLVIIKSLISNGSPDEQKEVLGYLEKKSSSVKENKDLILIFWEEGLPKKNNILYKFLESKALEAKKQNFEKLSGQKINQWVLKRFKELDPKASITNSALEKLAAFSGGDVHALNSEIQKLINFSGGARIEDRDVAEIVNSNLNISIFNMIDALGSNNKEEAAKLLHEHLKRGADPFYLFSMFVYQFRNLLKVADLKDRSDGGEYEIARMAGLHPFVVKKSLAQIRNFTFSKLKDIYQQLAELDTKIKTGKIDIQLALDKFLIEL